MTQIATPIQFENRLDVFNEPRPLSVGGSLRPVIDVPIGDRSESNDNVTPNSRSVISLQNTERITKATKYANSNVQIINLASPDQVETVAFGRHVTYVHIVWIIGSGTPWLAVFAAAGGSLYIGKAESEAPWTSVFSNNTMSIKQKLPGSITAWVYWFWQW